MPDDILNDINGFDSGDAGGQPGDPGIQPIDPPDDIPAAGYYLAVACDPRGEGTICIAEHEPDPNTKYINSQSKSSSGKYYSPGDVIREPHNGSDHCWCWIVGGTLHPSPPADTEIPGGYETYEFCADCCRKQLAIQLKEDVQQGGLAATLGQSPSGDGYGILLQDPCLPCCCAECAEYWELIPCPDVANDECLPEDYPGEDARLYICSSVKCSDGNDIQEDTVITYSSWCWVATNTVPPEQAPEELRLNLNMVNCVESCESCCETVPLRMAIACCSDDAGPPVVYVRDDMECSQGVPVAVNQVIYWDGYGCYEIQNKATDPIFYECDGQAYNDQLGNNEFCLPDGAVIPYGPDISCKDDCYIQPCSSCVGFSCCNDSLHPCGWFNINAPVTHNIAGYASAFYTWSCCPDGSGTIVDIESVAGSGSGSWTPGAGSCKNEIIVNGFNYHQDYGNCLNGNRSTQDNPTQESSEIALYGSSKTLRDSFYNRLVGQNVIPTPYISGRPDTPFIFGVSMRTGVWGFAYTTTFNSAPTASIQVHSNGCGGVAVVTGTIRDVRFRECDTGNGTINVLEYEQHRVHMIYTFSNVGRCPGALTGGDDQPQMNSLDLLS